MASLVSLWSYRISLFESLSRVPVKLHDIDFRCVAISLSASYSLPDSQFSLASASAPGPELYSCDFVGLTAIRFVKVWLRHPHCSQTAAVNVSSGDDLWLFPIAFRMFTSSIDTFAPGCREELCVRTVRM